MDIQRISNSCITASEPATAANQDNPLLEIAGFLARTCSDLGLRVGQQPTEESPRTNIAALDILNRKI